MLHDSTHYQFGFHQRRFLSNYINFPFLPKMISLPSPEVLKPGFARNMARGCNLASTTSPGELKLHCSCWKIYFYVIYFPPMRSEASVRDLSSPNIKLQRDQLLILRTAASFLQFQTVFLAYEYLFFYFLSKLWKSRVGKASQ